MPSYSGFFPLAFINLDGKFNERFAVQADSDWLNVAELFDRKECRGTGQAEAATAVPAVVHFVEEPIEFDLAVKTVKCKVLRDPYRRFARLVVGSLGAEHLLLFC